MDVSFRVATATMIKEIVKEEGAKNVVMSPASIFFVLSMITAGAGGKTRDQLLHFLDSDSIEDLNSRSRTMLSLLKPTDGRFVQSEGPNFHFANAIFMDCRFTLRKAFKKTVQSTYRALFATADMVVEYEEEKERINTWVQHMTQGMITEIVPQTMRLMGPVCLANALYFEGDWLTPFLSWNTTYGDFFLLGGNQIQVSFLTKHNKKYLFDSFDEFKLIKLPYKNDRSKSAKFSMYMFLPHARDGLKDLVEKFDSDDTAKMLYSRCFKLKGKYLSRVRIPKIKFSYGEELGKILRDRGLQLPFCHKSANFKKMVSFTGVEASAVHIQEIMQKTFIEVDEAGTKATAATATLPIASGRRAAHSSTQTFVADHPYLFMIVEDESQLIFFTGVVLNPLLD